jgi:gluconate 2-dehydrogenase gamma chain
MRRRHFLTVSCGGLLIYSLDGSLQRLAAQQGQVKIPLRFFTEPEARIVAAAAARIFPTDESGPGASEAGVVIYIDRQLGSPYGRDRYRYRGEPFLDGPPELGYQGPLTPRDIYRQGLESLAGFTELDPAAQDARLRAIQHTEFFQLLLRHTIEGMFCDPMHGGNVDKLGWQLIGFPGPRMSYLRDVDSHYGQPFRPKPESLEEILGRKVIPSEDEPEP